MTRGYLRFPHIAGEQLTFVAENDVWLAPVSRGKAWREDDGQRPGEQPRLSPDGQDVAWTSTATAPPKPTSSSSTVVSVDA